MGNKIKIFGKLVLTVLSGVGLGKGIEKSLEARRRKMAMDDSLKKANMIRKGNINEKSR